MIIILPLSLEPLKSDFVLVILTHLFDSYYTHFKDKDNGFLRGLLLSIY